MSQDLYKSYGIDPNKPFSALNFLAKKFKQRNILGWILTIFGLLSLITSIILLSTIGLIGIIVILPVPVLLIPGLTIMIPLIRSGVISSYTKVKFYFNKKDIAALESLKNLPLKNDAKEIITKNYLLGLFGVAALIDLNIPNSNLLALQFYRSCQNSGIKENEARIIIETLALKNGTTASYYLGI